MKSVYEYEVTGIGPDEFSESDEEDIYGGYSKVVYWYRENKDGGGSGIAIGILNESSIDICSLEHGPNGGPTEWWQLNAIRSLPLKEAHTLVTFGLSVDSLSRKDERKCRKEVASFVASL